MTATTVGELCDELRFDFLEAADEAWVVTSLTSNVDDSTTSWPIDLGALGIEEEDLLSLGVIVECGSEQAYVTGLSGSTLAVRRGARGTTAAEHDSGDEVRIAPPFTRQTMFGAVADSIMGLFPDLYTHTGSLVSAGISGVTEVPDDVVAVTNVRRMSNNTQVTFDDLGTYPDPEDDESTIRAIRVYSIPSGSELFVTYRGRFTYPASEATVLADIGIQPEWQRIVKVGAAAQLISGKPMSQRWQNYLSAQLASEAYPVESPNRIRDALIGYHSYLLSAARAALTTQYPPSLIAGS